MRPAESRLTRTPAKLEPTERSERGELVPEPAVERSGKFAGRNVPLTGDAGVRAPDPPAGASGDDVGSGRGFFGGWRLAGSLPEAVTPTSLTISTGMSEIRVPRAMQTSYAVQLSSLTATRAGQQRNAEQLSEEDLPRVNALLSYQTA